MKDSGSFWDRASIGRGTCEYLLVDADRGERKPAFDHARLACTLQAEGCDEAQPDRLDLRELDWPEPDILCFTTAGKRWRVSLDSYVVVASEEHQSPSLPAVAPRDAPK